MYISCYEAVSVWSEITSFCLNIPTVIGKTGKSWKNRFSWISQFTVAVWAWADKGHCRTNCEIHWDEILDTCSWKLCNHYSFMHKQCTPWYTGVSILWKGGNKGYLCSTSIAVGVIISKCTKWDFFMFWISVDIRGHCSHVIFMKKLWKMRKNITK